MKVRRGFVTNSSSSSFIFSNINGIRCTIESIRELFIEGCKKILSGEITLSRYSFYSKQDYNDILATIENQRGTNNILSLTAYDISSLTNEQLLEVFGEYNSEEVSSWYTFCNLLEYDFGFEWSISPETSLIDPRDYECAHTIITETLQKLISKSPCKECTECLEGPDIKYIPKSSIGNCRCHMQHLLGNIAREYLSRDYIDIHEFSEEVYPILHNYKDRISLIGNILLYDQSEFMYSELAEYLKQYTVAQCTHMG